MATEGYIRYTPRIRHSRLEANMKALYARKLLSVGLLRDRLKTALS